ncbi:MAG: putative capsular polysaccharide synthesis family protein [Candidatus Hodarchaeota archaeon]
MSYARHTFLKGYSALLEHNFAIKVRESIVKLLLNNSITIKLLQFFLFYYLDLKIKEQNRVVLLYQMGKVGSRTIRRSLEALGIPVYHVHQLRRIEKALKEHHSKIWILTLLNYSWFALYFKKHQNNLDYKKWKLISLVRDPIARNVSLFFENFRLALPKIIRMKKAPITLENIRDLFLYDFPNHNFPLSWFNEEMKQIFGIDVFTEEFPKTQGYKIYTGKHLDLLLLKLEQLNDCASVAFNEFLGIKGFTLRNANLTKEKDYFSIYKKFISAKILPESYVEKLYASKFSRHFYTEEELNIFRKKWLAERVNENGQ